MNDRPKIKDFFSEEITISKVHACYIIVPELYNYMQALDAYIDEIEESKAAVMSDPKLTPLHKCMELKGKYYGDNIVELSDCMSVRLANVIKTAKNTFDKYPVYYETMTYKDTYKIRALGKKSWDEFVELRSVFVPAREQNK